jgi:hypothetical protein
MAAAPLRVVPEARADRPLNWPTLCPHERVRIQTRCRLAGPGKRGSHLAPIGRPLSRSGIHTTHRARGPSQVVAAVV